jgi:hypothetical protein
MPLWIIIISMIGTFFLASVPLTSFVFGFTIIELDAFIFLGTFSFGLFGGILLFYQLSSKIKGYSLVIPISLIINFIIDAILFTNIIKKGTGMILLAFTNLIIFLLAITVLIQKNQNKK